MSAVVRGKHTQLEAQADTENAASEAYRTRSIALWKTLSFPRRAMRSAFRSLGVPPTREAGTASFVGDPLNRPMHSGFAENSFLITQVSRPMFEAKSYAGAVRR